MTCTPGILQIPTGRFFRLLQALAFTVALLTASIVATAQEWSYYGGTQAGTKYSALDQINRENVTELEVAWTYRTGELKRLTKKQQGQQSFENTPTLVAGSLIVCTPTGRIIALDPATGEERWVFDPNSYPLPENIHYPKCRGVSHWVDKEAGLGTVCRHRIIYGTWDFKAFAIDSGTGRRCPDFGNNGEVRFDAGKPLIAGEFIYIPSPPAVVSGVAIFGSMIFDNLRNDAPSGKVRAIDLRTGQTRWEFDPIPRDPSDPAASTWHGKSATTTGHGNVWSIMSVDEQRGLVFLPTTSPSPDFYGGLRPGENRYTDSVVALHGDTGKMAWHYQITHHDIWDYDLPAQPILIDLTREGQSVPAVVQLTKQGLVFVLHRETGKPLFPVEERPVPQSGVAGEWLSATQPVPVLPPPLVAQGMVTDDAWGFTILDRNSCRKQLEELRQDGMYTPPSLQGSVLMPSFAGGVNWGGGAWDPERKLLITSTIHIAGVAKLVPREDIIETGTVPEVDVNTIIRFPQKGTPYIVENWLLFSPLGAPCSPPPWSRLTAVDLEQGTIKWQVALGSLEKLLPVPLSLEMGAPHAGGAIVTAGGVVFIAATADDAIRAFDTESGDVLWKEKLPAGGQATPMTYSVNHRQYLVIAAGGHALYKTTPGDYVIAYSLKQASSESSWFD